MYSAENESCLYVRLISTRSSTPRNCFCTPNQSSSRPSSIRRSSTKSASRSRLSCSPLRRAIFFISDSEASRERAMYLASEITSCRWSSNIINDQLSSQKSAKNGKIISSEKGSSSCILMPGFIPQRKKRRDARINSVPAESPYHRGLSRNAESSIAPPVSHTVNRIDAGETTI